MDIKHDKETNKFYVKLDSGEANLTYSYRQEDILDYKSTYVPNEHRGQGIAGEITDKALQYAKENNLKVVPSCPFVEDYINHHEEYSDIIA